MRSACWLVCSSVLCCLSSLSAHAASLVVEPTLAPAGRLFRVAGFGFGVQETVTVTLAGEVDTVVEVVAGNNGAFVRFWDSTGQEPGRVEVHAESAIAAESTWLGVGRALVVSELHGFDDDQLDGGWEWLREDPGSWSLGEVPGALRMYTRAGTLVGAANDQANLLLRSVPEGDFRVTAHLEIHADQTGQHAGLYLFRDDDHWLRLVRGYASGPGSIVELAAEAGDSLQVRRVAEPATDIQLMLAAADGVVRGFASADGNLWTLVGEVEAGFEPTRLGLSAANGGAELVTEIPADVHWLRVDSLVDPETYRPARPPGGVLRLNEVVFHPIPPRSEWVELVNAGDRAMAVGGFEVVLGDDTVVAIPDALPALPPAALVVIAIDGRGASLNDLDPSDGVAVIHSAAGVVDVLDDAADTVAVYSGPDHGPETMIGFMAYGEAPMSRAADAVEANLWRRAWFVPLWLGDGWEGDGEPHVEGFSVGVLPGARHTWPRAWALYIPTTTSPGLGNDLPVVPWFNPRSGAGVDGETAGVMWHGVRGAAGYHFQLADTANFAAPLVDQVVGHWTWQTDQPLGAGTYYWRVQVLARDGRSGPWLEPVELEVWRRDPGKTLASLVLPVPWDRQRKDSHLLCVDGDARWSTDPWDAPHPNSEIFDHGQSNCCRASIAVVNHYYGGDISQDYLSYVYLENHGDPYRYAYRVPPLPRDEWPEWVGTLEMDLGHDFATGPGSNELAAWAWGVHLADLDQVASKPAFDWIKARIDDGRPMLHCYQHDHGGHCNVVAGYQVLAGGMQEVWIIEIGRPPPGYWLTYVDLEDGFFTAPPAGIAPVPEREPPGINADDDGDGIMNFDEIHRFMTNPNARDTDGDGIGDKEEIGYSLFEADGSYYGFSERRRDRDHDQLAMELDTDSDDDGQPDGTEDANRNGVFEWELGETSNWNPDDRGGDPELLVTPIALQYSFSTSNQQIAVINYGGGGLVWDVEDLPEYITVNTSLPSMVLAQETRHVDITIDRGLIPGGEHEDSFTITSVPDDYGRQEVIVRILEDDDGPQVDSFSPAPLPDLWAAGCPTGTTLLVTAEISDDGSGIDRAELEALGWRELETFIFPMSRVGNQWEGVLGPLDADYYQGNLVAHDAAGHSSTYSLGTIDVGTCREPEFRSMEISPQRLLLPPCDEAVLTVQAEISYLDEDDIAVVEMSVPIPGGSELRTALMEHQGGNLWSAEVGPFATPGTLAVHVIASSSNGHVTGSQEREAEIVDCDGPTIGAVTAVPDEVFQDPCEPYEVVVSADPISPSGWVEAEVWLRAPGADVVSQIFPMTRVADSDRFEAGVDGMPEPGSWRYRVVARNQDGGETRSPVDTFEVVDCPGSAPQIGGVTVDDDRVFVEPCAPTSTTVRVQIAENEALRNVQVAWKYQPETAWNLRTMSEGSATEFHAPLGPFEAVGTVNVMVQVYDTAGRLSTSDVYALPVLDCQTGPEIHAVAIEPATLFPDPCGPDEATIQAIVLQAEGQPIDEVMALVEWDGTLIDDVQLTQVGSTTWEGVISGLTVPAVYDVQVVAYDVTRESAASPWDSLVVLPCEVQGPDIYDVQANQTTLFVAPCEPQRLEVRARAEDQSGIDSVQLRYRPRATASTLWLAQDMTLMEGGFYEGETTGLTPGIWLWSVQATNASGVATWSEPSAMMVHHCQVPGPTIDLAELDDELGEPPCLPRRLTVQARLQDQHDITEVNLVSRLPGVSWQVRAMSETIAGQWEARVGPSGVAGRGVFVVTARNALDGWSVSDIGTVDIPHCSQPTLATPTLSPPTASLEPCDVNRVRVEVEVTDDRGIDGGWVVFREPGGGDTVGVVRLQSRPGTAIWGADLGPFERVGTYPLALLVVNEVGGSAWSEEVSFAVEECSAPSVDIVDLSATSVWAAPCQPNQITVNALLSSDSGIAGAWVAHRPVGAERLRFTAMAQSQQPEQYEATLPPSIAAGAHELVVVARSGWGGWATSDSLETWDVNECSQPTIQNVTLSAAELQLPPCDPSTALISANVADEVGLEAVSLRLRDRRDEQWSVLAMEETATPGRYAVLVGPFDAAGIKDWQIVAVSTRGGRAASPAATLTVGDCPRQ